MESNINYTEQAGTVDGTSLTYAQSYPLTTINAPHVLTATPDSEGDKKQDCEAKQDWAYVSLEVKVPRSLQEMSVITLVRDFMGVVSDKDAQIISLRITENRW